MKLSSFGSTYLIIPQQSVSNYALSSVQKNSQEDFLSSSDST